MTHRYTLLVGGTVISGRDDSDASAIAWAADTVIAIGSDDDVRVTSRGDSHVVDLAGAVVVGLGEGLDVRWPTEATLEIGGRADMAVLAHDPRATEPTTEAPLAALAVVRGGRVVAGRLPGASTHDATVGDGPDHH